MPSIDNFDSSHAVSLIGTGPGASRRLLRAGDVIGGLYVLKALVGQGGGGYVFRAEHNLFKRDYALKMLAPEMLNDESRQRFEIEGRAIANLDHSHIVKVYDMGLDEENCPYYVMDLLDGVALSDCIRPDQGIDFQECIDIGRKVASGLGYAHSKGIVHRDVKPSNIILLPEVNGRKPVKIVDFGIVKVLPSAQLRMQAHTATGAVFGSPYYMSPEQCLGSKVDQRTDIYSLGCTLFEAICGRPPFPGQNALETVMMHQEAPIPSVLATKPRANLPESVDILMAKLLAKRPENRYQSMDQVGHDLRRIKHGKSIGPVMVSTSSPSSPASAGTAPSVSPSSSAYPSFRKGGRESMVRTAYLDAKSRDQRSSVEEAEDAGRLGLLLKLGGAVLALGIVACACLSYPTLADMWKASHSNQGARAKHDPANTASGPEFVAKYQKRKQIEDKIAPVFFGDIGASADAGQSTQEEVKARDIFRQAVKIKSKLVTINGVECKRFNFPDWPLGVLTDRKALKVSACRDAVVPANTTLTLEVGDGKSVHVLQYPDILAKIDAGELSGVSIKCRNLSGFRGMMENVKGPLNPLEGVLPILVKWTKLDNFTVVGFPVSAHEFDLLDKLPNLCQLELDDCLIHTEDLTRQPLLRRLTALALARSGKVQPICDRLSGSSNLQELVLFECNTTGDALLKLRSCPRLWRLDLQENEFNQLIPAVVQIKSLKEVRFADCGLKPAQIRILTACPNIRRLVLSKVAMSQRDIQYCLYNEPKVRFDDL